MKPDRRRRLAGPEGAAARLDLRFEAEPFAVRKALGRTVATFSGQISENAAAALELALAEVLNNIVIHAYDRRGGSIALSVEARTVGLHCRVSDHGKAMPQEATPGAGADARPAALPVPRDGGWGWHILHKIARNFAYERVGQENRLTFSIAMSAD